MSSPLKKLFGSGKSSGKSKGVETPKVESQSAPTNTKPTGITDKNATNNPFQIIVTLGTSPVASDAQYIGAIDQGTSSTRFLVFDSAGLVVASAQMETHQYYPHVGWHEHDPVELYASAVHCVNAVQEKCGHDLKLNVIGITNQRETTLAWNKQTGKPYYNAIVWDDLRTTHIAGQIPDANDIQKQTGLPVASYFAGTKVKWLIENVDELKKDLHETPSDICFGTVDTWLVYQLTGQQAIDENLNRGGLFVTDATNASRWLFMDLLTQQWDASLIEKVTGTNKIPLSSLPEIHASSHVYGKCSSLKGTVPDLFHAVPIGSILGDQQAALFGQAAFEPGQAKNTYGTGLFLMMNTGTKAVTSTHGLLTTIAYQIQATGSSSDNKTTVYALEGSVAHSGSTIQWLRDQLGIIQKASDAEHMAATQNEGVYFVPAFAGLFAPRWRPDARACIVGMTSSHNKSHVIRAALEATAYQTREVFDAIVADSDVRLTSLKVDGGVRTKLVRTFDCAREKEKYTNASTCIRRFLSLPLL
jgi:glycerol kinase